LSSNLLVTNDINKAYIFIACDIVRVLSTGNMLPASKHILNLFNDNYKKDKLSACKILVKSFNKLHTKSYKYTIIKIKNSINENKCFKFIDRELNNTMIKNIIE